MQVFDTLFQTSPVPHVGATSAPELDVEKAFDEAVLLLTETFADTLEDAVPFEFATLVVVGVLVTTGTLAIATGSIADGYAHFLSSVSQLFGATQFTQFTPVSYGRFLGHSHFDNSLLYT